MKCTVVQGMHWACDSSEVKVAAKKNQYKRK